MAITINGTTGISGVDGSAGTPALQGSDPNTGISFGTDEVNINTGGSTRATVNSSGRVGIGTTSPQATLHLESSAGAQLRIKAGVANAQIDLIPGGQTNPFYIYCNSSRNLVFQDNSAQRARIDSDGRFLVGTSSAVSTDTNGFLHIAGPTSGNMILANKSTSLSVNASIGAIRFFSNAGSVYEEHGRIQCVAEGASGSGDKPGRLAFFTTADGSSAPTERMRIANDGRTSCFSSGQGVTSVVSAAAGTTVQVLVAGHSATGINTGTTSFRVWSNGNVQNTNNSYGALSDIKLKENIVDANSQWDDLKALKVRNYNLKEGETHTQIGLVAQEAELVSPGLVSESPDRDEDGNDLGTVTKSVNYSVLYMKAVKALQEAMERIETLEASNADLAARLTALEGGAE